MYSPQRCGEPACHRPLYRHSPSLLACTEAEVALCPHRYASIRCRCPVNMASPAASRVAATVYFDVALRLLSSQKYVARTMANHSSLKMVNVAQHHQRAGMVAVTR